MTQFQLSTALAPNFSPAVLSECSSLMSQSCVTNFFTEFPVSVVSDAAYQNHIKHEVCSAILFNPDQLGAINQAINFTSGLFGFGSYESPPVDNGGFNKVASHFFRRRDDVSTRPNLITRVVDRGHEMKLGDQTVLEVVSKIQSRENRYSLLTTACTPGGSTGSGFLPLNILASLSFSDKIVKGLLQGGANPNEVDTTSGCSPLHQAAWNINTVKALLERGADKNRPCYSGVTPLDLVDMKKMHNSEGLTRAYIELSKKRRAHLSGSYNILTDVGAKRGEEISEMEQMAWSARHFCERYLFCLS